MLRIARLMLPCAVLLTALVTREAGARPPFTETRTGLAISGRYGVPLGKNATQNPWTNGLGLDYGTTLYGGLYLGVTADTFWLDRGVERYGETDQTIIRGRIGSAQIDVGQDWGIAKPLALRVSVGIGPGWGGVRHCSLDTQSDGTTERVCDDVSNPRAVAHARATLLGKLSRRFFVLGQTEWLYDSGFEEATTGIVFALGAGYAF